LRKLFLEQLMKYAPFKMKLQMLNGKRIIYGSLISLALTSCVTQKKFDDLNARKTMLEADKAICDENLQNALAANEQLEKDLSNFKANIENLQRNIAKLELDTTQTGIILRKTLNNYDALNTSYERLLQNHERLRQNSASETSKLSSDLSRREKELLDSQQRINNLNADLQAREARVQELEKVLADKEKAVNDLKNKVSGALLGFKDNDLKVEVKNGKVFVSLSEQLLFKSGSINVDAKGVDALKKLAGVLKDQDDLSVMVEGHTDDVPISKGTNGIKDNWDLSVLRATSIVRILTESGVQPVKLVASGRGEYMPVDEAKTKEGRQKNRRTEIILTPKLDELFKILDAQ